MVQVALALDTVCALQPVMLLAPFLKFTVPVGLKPSVTPMLTLKVTLLPTPEGFKLDVGVDTVGVTFAAAKDKVGVDVLEARRLSPAKVAVIEWFPVPSTSTPLTL